MTTEGVKNYLRTYQAHVRRVKEIEEEIRCLRLDRMCPLPMQRDGMPRGNAKSDLSDYVVKSNEKIEELVDERTDCQYAKKKIIKQIKRIGNRYEKDVLFWRYIGGLKWEKVAEKVGLSLSQTYVYHGRGLKKMLK